MVKSMEKNWGRKWCRKRNRDRLIVELKTNRLRERERKRTKTE